MGEGFLLLRICLGGVGGPAGPLTVIVSAGFPGGAGSFLLAKTFLTRRNGRQLVTELTVTECKTSLKCKSTLTKLYSACTAYILMYSSSSCMGMGLPMRKPWPLKTFS